MNFLRKKTTAKRVGYHPSHVMRLVRANKFPRRFSSARTQSRSSKRKWTPGCRPASPSAMSGAIRRRPSTRVRSTAAVPRNGSSPRRQRDGMADHKDEGPAPRQRRPFGYGYADNERCNSTPDPQSPSIEALDRLGLFRTSLDDWKACGCAGPTPTPDQFGLRLGVLSSSEIYWRAA